MRELSTVSIFFRKYIKILHPNISNFTRIWSRIIYVKSNFKNKKRGVVMNILKKVLMVSICFTTLAILSSCGTVHGFGKDVSTVGKDIQRASR
ncbi:entericidin A/B family lipoprotein [Legionella steelei]|uniref:entericidin A/B family lipoprotein n=1 Tax=Legionella steelei TaxID=947033 RepID=UPI003A521485